MVELQFLSSSSIRFAIASGVIDNNKHKQVSRRGTGPSLGSLSYIDQKRLEDSNNETKSKSSSPSPPPNPPTTVTNTQHHTYFQNLLQKEMQWFNNKATLNSALANALIYFPEFKLELFPAISHWKHSFPIFVFLGLVTCFPNLNST